MWGIVINKRVFQKTFFFILIFETYLEILTFGYLKITDRVIKFKLLF